MDDVNVTGPAIEMMLESINHLQTQNYIIIAVLVAVFVFWIGWRNWE